MPFSIVQTVRYVRIYADNQPGFTTMSETNYIKILKTSIFKILAYFARNLANRGLGKIPLLKNIYDYLYRNVAIDEAIINVYGSRMIVRVSDNDEVSSHLLYSRNGYEHYQTDLFQKLVTKGLTVIDIGANIGYYTVLAASLVGDKGKVFAFEPEPQNYALLVRNIELNGYKNVTLVRKAVSSKNNRTDLFINRATGAHSILSGHADTVQVTPIETVKLDQYFRGRESPIDIVKIDVEGTELDVIKGMTNIIKNNDNLKIFTELFCTGGAHQFKFLEEFWEVFIASGFKFIYLINERARRLDVMDRLSLLRYCKYISSAKISSPNLLCTKSKIYT